MIGDRSDVIRRLRAVLPAGWFSDTAPVLDALLGGLAAASVQLFQFIEVSRLQQRLLTASGTWLDRWASDFLGQSLVRRRDEDDSLFRSRVRLEILRHRGTRSAVKSLLVDVTGRTPIIFEPRRPADTGSYGGRADSSSTGLAYGICGGWGSLSLPYQMFVTAYRSPGATGLAVGGWGTGGYNDGFCTYGDLRIIRGATSDEEIHRAVASVLPVTATAWLRILS